MKFQEAVKRAQALLAFQTVPPSELEDLLEAWREERTTHLDLLRRWVKDIGVPLDAAIEASDVFANDFIGNQDIDGDVSELMVDTETVLNREPVKEKE